MLPTFISYRRQDDDNFAGRLCDRLKRQFGASRVFFDVDDIPPGTDFEKLIRARLTECGALIAIIGPGWLHAQDEQGNQRLAMEGDWVRTELMIALELGVPVIPVLVGNVVMPKSSELPEILVALLRRQAFRVRTDDGFHDDVTRLIKRLKRGFVTRSPGSRFSVVLWVAVPIVLGGLLVLLVGRHVFEPNEYRNRRDSFVSALPWLNWVVYDPVDYNPYSGVEPTEWSVRQDLTVVREHGFNGLITMGSKGQFKHVPRLAHEAGFRMVIAGVWDLKSRDEVDNAIAVAQWVDAYCVGQRGLNERYSEDELKTLIESIRRKTSRPVTTSQVISDYETNPGLRDVGDFLFPDVHSHLNEPQTPKAAWDEVRRHAVRAAAWAASKQKPLLLHMLTYPSGGAGYFTPQSQAEFYRLVTTESRDRVDFPSGVSFSFLGAFDPIWKIGDRWADAERFTGLFTVDRKPKLAVTEVDWKIKR